MTTAMIRAEWSPPRWIEPSLLPSAKDGAVIQGWLRGLLNDVGFGIAIFNERLELCFLNERARMAFQACGIADQMDTTAVAGDRRSPLFQDFCRNARLASEGHRRLILLGDGAHQFAAAFSPLYLDDTAAGSGVLVTTERRRLCEASSLWAFARSQGLTSAEMRVLEELMAGHEPKNIAQRLDVSVTTIRTHIKSLLNKTDSGSMRGLLLRIAKLPPIRPVANVVTE